MNNSGKRKIFIKENCGECVNFAGEQLKKYLFKILNIDFDVINNNGDCAFMLGTTDNFPDDRFLCKDLSGKIKGDGFSVYVKNGVICIVGKYPRGCMYGVYDYLEKFYGVRFLTKDCELVPESEKLVDSFESYVSNPDFDMRGYLVGDTHDGDGKHRSVDFDFVAKTRVKDAFTEIPEKQGGKIDVYGRNTVHNFHCYCPFEQYGNDHPEWYRFFYVNAEVTPTIDLTNGITADGKLDDSMDISVAKVVIKEIIKDCESHPYVNKIHFSQEDGPYYYESQRVTDNINKYKWSGMLIRFCNVVIREVNKYMKEKHNRTIRLVTFAYGYAKEAPVKYVDGKCVPIDETVVADENITIQMALFANGTYSYFSPKQSRGIKKTMTEWRTIASDFWFWSYDLNFHKYIYIYDSFDQIQDNLRGFKDYGVSYLCVEGPYEECKCWHSNIRAYAYRKLLWDTTLDAESLMNEYCDIYYGVASPCVKKIIDIYHRNYDECRKDPEFIFATRGSAEKAIYNPESMLLTILDEIDKAEKLIDDSDYTDSEKAMYIERLMGVKATPLLMQYDMYFDHHPHGTKEEYLALRKKFFEVARKAKINTAGEHWTIDQFEQECIDIDNGIFNEQIKIYAE